MRRKRIVKVSNNRKVTVNELTAKNGLKAIISLSKLIESGAPYLGLLTDNSSVLRIAALSKFINMNDKDVYNTIFNIVSISTDIEVVTLEQEYTISDLFKLLVEVIKINNWTDFWVSAHSLRVIEGGTLLSWVWSKLNMLRM